MGDPSVQLTVPARAENVAVVRHAFAGLAAAMEMDPETIADLKTIVTEACMNVVVHAYEGEEGPLEVRAWPENGDLVLTVRDYGNGVRPLVDEPQLRVPAGDLVAPVLSRVVAMFAARADFSVDRLSDAILLSDAISANGPDEFPNGTAQIAIAEEDGAFVVHV